MQFSAVQCKAVQCSAVQCSAVPAVHTVHAVHAVQLSAVQCSALQPIYLLYSVVLRAANHCTAATVKFYSSPFLYVGVVLFLKFIDCFNTLVKNYLLKRVGWHCLSILPVSSRFPQLFSFVCAIRNSSASSLVQLGIDY